MTLPRELSLLRAPEPDPKGMAVGEEGLGGAPRSGDGRGCWGAEPWGLVATSVGCWINPWFGSSNCVHQGEGEVQRIKEKWLRRETEAGQKIFISGKVVVP